jgi:hypothetical protein
MMAVALTLTAGCASSASGPKQHSEIVAASSVGAARGASAPGEEQPRVITNLTQLSAADSTAPLVAQAQMLAQSAPSPDTSQAAPARSAIDTNLARLFLAKPDSRVYSEEVRTPGDVNLLNRKARQFPEFSYGMANRTLSAMQLIETATLGGRKLPDDIAPVVLIAVMTPQGRLRDLTIEQHSGVAAVDRTVIEACKKALWAMNPSPDARAADGTYRLRVESLVRNRSYNLKGQYHYITHVGLAVL